MTAAAPGALLSVSGLSVEFRTSERVVSAVRNVSFGVDRGETIAIVGESGSGKSVTALSLMRLVEHGGGCITSGKLFFARDSGSLDLAQASPSVMRQQVRIPEAAQVLGRYPHQLSGGMRQRVMIAMALSCKPKLLIADEPTTALDVTIQAQILELLRKIQRDTGMAILLITHDLGVVAENADVVAVMYASRVVEFATVEQIFDRPQHPYTRGLLRSVPKLGQ